MPFPKDSVTGKITQSRDGRRVRRTGGRCGGSVRQINWNIDVRIASASTESTVRPRSAAAGSWQAVRGIIAQVAAKPANVRPGRVEAGGAISCPGRAQWLHAGPLKRPAAPSIRFVTGRATIPRQGVCRRARLFECESSASQLERHATLVVGRPGTDGGMSVNLALDRHGVGNLSTRAARATPVSTAAAEPRRRRRFDDLAAGRLPIVDLAWPLNATSRLLAGRQLQAVRAAHDRHARKRRRAVEGVLLARAPGHAPRRSQPLRARPAERRPDSSRSNCSRPGVVIDVSARPLADADYRVSARRRRSVRRQRTARFPRARSCWSTPAGASSGTSRSAIATRT